MTRVQTALVVLLVSLTAGCVSGGSPSDPTSARGHVEALKVALVTSDATTLVRLVDDPSYAVSVALLTDAVLGHGALADQDVEVKKDRSDLETISYDLRTAGDDERPWLEPLVRSSGAFVSLPLPSFTLRGPGVTSVTVDGETVEIGPLPSDGQTFYLPPGDYQIGVGGAGRYVDYSPAQGYDTRDGVDGLSFTSQLSAAGRTRVQQQVDAFVRRCTEPVRGNPPLGCPVHKAWVGGLASSRWSLESAPRTVIRTSGDGWLLSTPEPPKAWMHGTVTDSETGVSEKVSDVVRFDVQARITVRHGDLVVDLDGS